jgi:hypothetical protein
MPPSLGVLYYFSYLILSSHFSTTVHPRCTVSLMAKAYTPPFAAAELWLPSAVGVAE